jgi:hypothetical protein
MAKIHPMEISIYEVVWNTILLYLRNRNINEDIQFRYMGLDDSRQMIVELHFSNLDLLQFVKKIEMESFIHSIAKYSLKKFNCFSVSLDIKLRISSK